MSKASIPTHRPAGPGWQMLAALDLRSAVDSGQRLSAWLTEALRPLGLHPAFQKKVLDSALSAARCEEAPAPDAATDRTWPPAQVTSSDADPLHLVIYVPTQPPVGEHHWGFFRVEKSKNAMAGSPMEGHVIAFYLYLEG